MILISGNKDNYNDMVNHQIILISEGEEDQNVVAPSCLDEKF